MREPAVRRRAVPMLHAGGNVHDRSGKQFDSFFAPFLVEAAAGDADQNLSAAGFGSGPCLRPAGVKIGMCQNFRDFFFGDAVLFRTLQMILKSGVGQSLRH